DVTRDYFPLWALEAVAVGLALKFRHLIVLALHFCAFFRFFVAVHGSHFGHHFVGNLAVLAVLGFQLLFEEFRHLNSQRPSLAIGRRDRLCEWAYCCEWPPQLHPHKHLRTIAKGSWKERLLANSYSRL